MSYHVWRPTCCTACDPELLSSATPWSTRMLCNSMENLTLEDVLLSYTPHDLTPHLSTMATSLGGGPTTLTLNPFHTNSGHQRGQQPRPSRFTQQSQRPISTPHIASPSLPAYTSSVSSTTIAPYVRGVAATTTTRPTVVQNANTYRPPRVAATNNAPNVPTSPSGRTLPIHAPGSIVTTIAKVHAIAPIQAPSIDSMLHSDPSEAGKTKTVPNCIRPRADAIE